MSVAQIPIRPSYQFMRSVEANPTTKVRANWYRLTESDFFELLQLLDSSIFHREAPTRTNPEHHYWGGRPGITDFDLSTWEGGFFLVVFGPTPSPQTQLF